MFLFKVLIFSKLPSIEDERKMGKSVEYGEYLVEFSTWPMGNGVYTVRLCPTEATVGVTAAFYGTVDLLVKLLLNIVQLHLLYKAWSMPNKMAALLLLFSCGSMPSYDMFFLPLHHAG